MPRPAAAAAPPGRARVGPWHPLLGGKHLDVDCCLVFEIKDSQIVDGREHFGDLCHEAGTNPGTNLTATRIKTSQLEPL